MTFRGTLETRGLTVRFGGQIAVNDVSCRFVPGSLTALVGPNGAGKTTLFNLVSGQIRPSAGKVMLDGRDITNFGVPHRCRAGIGRAFQLTQLFAGLSVFENIRIAVQAQRGESTGIWRSWRGLDEVNERAYRLLQEVGLEAFAQRIVAELSHGDQRKLEVAVLMALDPLVYMFDEPTAGMSEDDVPVVLGLINGLRKRGDRTILLVEHKMDVIEQLADRIVVLIQGQVRADGDPDEVMRSEIVQLAYLGVTQEEIEPYDQ